MESNATVSISKEQLAQMPLVKFPGEITVIDTPEAIAPALELLASNRLIGFDTETKPAFKKGCTNNVSLIQMSTEQHSFLFRINKVGFTPEMRAFMEDDSIVKIGLSLKDDFFVLHRMWEFTPKGFIDLQNFVKGYRISDESLQKIYAILFGERISKGQRLSNWEAEQLSDGQQMYASIDAWACLKIYHYLTSGKFEPEKSPYYIVKSTEE